MTFSNRVILVYDKSKMKSIKKGENVRKKRQIKNSFSQKHKSGTIFLRLYWRVSEVDAISFVTHLFEVLSYTLGPPLSLLSRSYPLNGPQLPSPRLLKLLPQIVTHVVS